MSMFMASMRNAMRDGELDGMGLFGAALKSDVIEYERKLREDDERKRFDLATLKDKEA